MFKKFFEKDIRKKLEEKLAVLDLESLGKPCDFTEHDGYRRWEFEKGKQKIIISAWGDGRRSIAVINGSKFISAGCWVK